MAKTLRQQRHKARVLAMQAVFQYDARKLTPEQAAEILTFNWMDYPVPEDERDYARKIISATVDNLTTIDERIKDRLVNWEFERISPVSRAILRTAVAQLMFFSSSADAPVVIDEAIQLAKKYDAEESASFVNAMLDGILRETVSPQPTKLETKIKIRKPPKKSDPA